ncbi:hypothetical protein CLOP_g20070 [Closterium sp. NIES-67]|nr:hypothetical protein CLOP_g20070 [Closterium sp. NIES-67]
MNERGGDANGRGAVPEKTSEPPPSKVEALDGSNYEEWSGRMRSAFKRYKLLKIAVGEEKMPEEGEARERWIEKSAVLFDLILQSQQRQQRQRQLQEEMQLHQLMGIGGYVCLLGGGAVSWRGKKQNEVGLSSCETEYMALHHGVKEVVWLRRLLEELGVGQEEPTVVFCDNESAVKLVKNACLHGLTKHIRPKWHWVRRFLDKEVRLEIVKTHQQAADIFTKRLAEADHWKGMKLAGMSVH